MMSRGSPKADAFVVLSVKLKEGGRLHGKKV